MSKKEQILDTPEKVIKKRRNDIRDKKSIQSFLGRLTFLLVFLWVLFGIIFGVTSMKDDSMKPRLSAGDIVLYYRLNGSIHIGDIVVLDKNGEQFIGRVVGRPGDEIEITEEKTLKVNGNTVVEPDVYYKTPQYEGGIEFPVKLLEDEYFILADFREGAKDSRIYGPVNKREMKGSVITVLRRSGL